MTIRPILLAPDPRLAAASEPVSAVNDEIRALVKDMLDSMYAADGIGLAAIQIGVPKRVVVMDLGPAKGTEGEKAPSAPQVFINPQITWASEDLATAEEGCLSVPDIWDKVERPAKVHVTYLDQDGVQQRLEADGLLACCIQHEMDHLQGTLFIDHLSKLKRSIALRKLAKNKRLKETG